MTFLKLVFILGFGLRWSFITAQTLQPQFNFSVNVLDLMDGELQYSVEVLPQKDLVAKYPELREFDSQNLLRDREGDFLISKSAFLVRKPIGFFDHQHMTNAAYLKFILGASEATKVDEETFIIKARSLKYRMRNFFDSDDISTLDQRRILHALSAVKSMDVLVQSANSSVVQELDQYSGRAKGAVFSFSHIPLRENRTLIVHYRLMALNPGSSGEKLKKDLLRELKDRQMRATEFK